MKKFTLLVIALMSFTMLRANIISGTCGENLTWSYNTDSHALVIEGSGDMLWVDERPWETVAGTILSISLPEGLTSIYYSAFNQCYSLTSVNFPQSLKVIGSQAFQYCRNLQSVDLPNGLEYIGSGAFYDSGLKSVELPNSVVEMDSYAFGSCSYLSSVVLPSGLSTMGESIFNECYALSEVVIPEGISAIGTSAFRYCSLSSISFPSTITTIGAYAFDHTGIYEVTLPASVTTVDYYAFSNCNNVYLEGSTPPTITSASFNSSATIHVPCASINAYQAATVWQFLNVIGSMDYKFNLSATQGGTARITNSVCQANTVVVEAEAEEGYRFTGWSDGNTDNPRAILLTADKEVTAQFERIMYNVNLSGIGRGYWSYYDSGDYYPSDEFWGSWSGQLPEGAYLSFSAYDSKCGEFGGWSDGVNDSYREFHLTQDTIISALYTGIETYQVSITAGEHGHLSNELVGTRTSCDGEFGTAAYADEGYHFVAWSDGYKYNERGINIYSDTTIYAIFDEGNFGGALGDSVYWKYVSETHTLTVYGSGPMSDPGYSESYFSWQEFGKDIQKVVIEEGVTSIRRYLFNGLTNLQEVEFPTTITEVGNMAFANCEVLTSIVWKPTHCEDAYEIFGYSNEANNISSITFANNVEYIPSNLCANTHITSVIIPASVRTIGWSAFRNCAELTTFVLPNTVTKVQGNILAGSGVDYPVYNNTLFAYMPQSTIGSYTVPQGIQTICSSSFYASKLTDITLPQSLKIIESDAFADCDNLAEIIVPAGVDTIESYAFESNPSLRKLVIPATVKGLGRRLVEECYNLQYIDAPADFFTRCIDNEYDDIEYIKSEYLRYYTHKLDTVILNRSAMGEQDFELIKQSYKTISYLNLGNTTNTSLQPEIFHNWFNLRHLVLPAGLEYIDYMAAAECIRLEDVTIPAAVTEIDARAFENCRSLASVTFAGANLTTIGDWAFYNCHELRNLVLPAGVTEIGKAAFFNCTYLDQVIMPASVQTIGDNAFAFCSRMSKMQVKAVVPPSINTKTFEEVSRMMPVYVPTASVTAYKADALWGQMNIIGQDEEISTVENTGVDQMSRKQILNGQLFILLPNGSKYSATGVKME